MNIESNKEVEVETENIFDGGDFVFTTRIDENGKTEVVGGGYKINSFFLQGGIPVLKTFNSENIDLDQNGGKVSTPFENLAVPAGLFYINQRVTKVNDNDKKGEHYYKSHETISDDMFDKLFGLVEMDKKKQRKTRKHTNSHNKTNKLENITKRKTRRIIK
jgi:hypothetical protein